MNLPNAQFWFLHAASLEAVVSKLTERPTGALEAVSKRPKMDVFGDEIEQMRMVGPVAIVPVNGPLMKGARGSDKEWGFSSYEDIADDIDSAKSQGAKAVVLNISSPGGTAVGAGELARYIRDAGLPVASYTDSMCCSAAEYLSASAGLRVATADAIVGSIGTVMTTVSFQGALDRMGIKVNVHASGKYKAAGHPAKDLTEEQAEYLQGFVDTLAGEFKGWMSEHRPRLKEESMQGQVFTGKQASQNGLIDGVSAGLPALIELLTKQYGGR